MSREGMWRCLEAFKGRHVGNGTMVWPCMKPCGTCNPAGKVRISEAVVRNDELQLPNPSLAQIS
eukprot:1157919-Pelagomonas_calceolata.AAC.2